MNDPKIKIADPKYHWKNPLEAPQCDCGHGKGDHHANEGFCDECACTWYYPNVAYIKRKQRRFKYYKVTKSFQGGSRIYYARMPVSRRLPKGDVEHQLEAWGESTDGGHCYGYRIKMQSIRNLPKRRAGQKLSMLKFCTHLLVQTKREAKT